MVCRPYHGDACHSKHSHAQVENIRETEGQAELTAVAWPDMTQNDRFLSAPHGAKSDRQA
jgi:hypothetical protein